MLILTRKPRESITIGENVKITILEIKGNSVRVGIEAPPTLAVHREEVFRLIREQNIGASRHGVVMPERLQNLWQEWKKRNEES